MAFIGRSPGAGRLGSLGLRPICCPRTIRTCCQRAQLTTPLDAAADAYLVDGRHGKTIVAGYPWFTDWGRDTFIAMRGLVLALGRLDDARKILLTWSGTVSEGMLPNRFPDKGDVPEYNSVDASLWFIIAVGEFLEACRRRQYLLDVGDLERLESAVAASSHRLRSGHAAHGIRARRRATACWLARAPREPNSRGWTPKWATAS